MMTFNAFLQRLIALFACMCLAVSGPGAVWAQVASANVDGTAGIAFGEIVNDQEIQLFLAQADLAQVDTGNLGFDITAPSIEHTPSVTKGVAGEVQTVVAEITDNQSVARALLIYRTSTADFYANTDMSADVTNQTWLATIDTTPEDTLVHYYIVAEDADGNRVQKGSESNPLTLDLQRVDLFSTLAPIKQDNRTKWVGIGLGVLAAGVLLLATSNSGGDGDDNPGIVSSDGENECCTITFIVPNVTTE